MRAQDQESGWVQAVQVVAALVRARAVVQVVAVEWATMALELVWRSVWWALDSTSWSATMRFPRKQPSSARR